MPFATECCEVIGQPFLDTPMSARSENTTSAKLTASRRASHAKMSRSRDKEEDLPESVLGCFTSLRESCKNFDPLGSFSRMFPDFSVQTKDETLQKSSAFSWSSAGMGFRGVCLTADISTWPNDAKECSLSAVLESHVPQRFFLSPRAARGILRRAHKRGRILPFHLQGALESLAMIQDGDMKTTSTSSQDHSVAEMTELGDEQKTSQTSFIECVDSEIMRPQPQPQKSEIGKTQQTSLWQGQLTLGIHQRDMEPLAQELRIFPISSPTHCEETSETTLMTVRRLTPTECETLQGFPKGWTLPDTEASATRSRRRSRTGSPAES